MTTLAEYMHWLTGVGGQCRRGIGADEKIGMVPIIKLIAPDGAYVIHGGNNEFEVLSPLIISYFDRRLGLESPFRSQVLPFKKPPVSKD